MNLKQTEKFYKNKEVIKRVILSKTDPHEVIHGQMALNKQFPKHLRTHTRDYDIYSEKYRKDAREVEKALDKELGGNYFRVELAKHPGTRKVVSNVDNKTYADYTKSPNHIPHRKISGKNYASLEYFKNHIAKTLKDPTAKYRHAKDKLTLQKIKLAEQKIKRVTKRKIGGKTFW